jgi:phenylalanyl-tRNA synthetase beta chain
MKASLNWIKEYTKLTLTPEELRDRVSVSLTEVESLEEFGEKFKNMVVSEVVSVDTHEKSDDLLVLELDTGRSNVQVVVQKCPVKVGDLVPYLPPGTMIPGEIGAMGKKGKVEVASIKGIESNGMVPSGRELGLNHDHTTVYTIPEKAEVGSPFSQVLELTDQILEIKNKALTHRPDVFSIEGLAREIAAIQGTKYKPLSWLKDWEGLKPEKDTEDRYPVIIENDAKALCPRYMAVVLDGVRVKASPKWLEVRLAKHGIRPVNNIVDISNYLMLEVGQPSHTFDYDKVVGKDPNFDGTAVITVRMAKGGEKITTLDGQSRELHSDTVIIADSANPIGVAGVMGGKDTEITNDTKRVIFQVENLDMYNVRKTAMKLGLISDAVTRFSKGLDPNMTEPVLYKGMTMMQELAGGTVASKIQDHYDSPVRPKSISTSPGLIRARLGAEISDSKMTDILGRLGLEPKIDKKNNTITVMVPTNRRDLSIQQDLDEEIVRIYGYDNVKPTHPVREVRPVPFNQSRELKIEIKQDLKGMGANELYTYSFVGKDLYEICGLSIEEAHKLRNPLSPELEYMRPVILPSLCEKIGQIVKEKPEAAVFEIDMVNPVGTVGGPAALPEEPWHCALMHTKGYYSAKLYLEELLKSLHVRGFSLVSPVKSDISGTPAWISHIMPMFHPSRLAMVKVGKETIGVIGELRTEARESLGDEATLAGFELDCDVLADHVSKTPCYQEPSVYPSVVHDFSFVVDRDVPYDALISVVEREESEIVKEVRCVDIYAQTDTSPKKKVTIRVVMQSREKTLEDADIESARKDIIDAVAGKVGGTLAGE